MDYTVRIINLTFQVTGAMLCMFTWMALKNGSKRGQKTGHVYEEMLLVTSLMLYFDALAYFARFWPGMMAFFGVRISSLLHFAFLERIIVLFSQYQKTYLEERFHVNVSSKYTKIADGFGILYIILLLINFFFPFGYLYDAQNMYMRLGGFWVFAIIPNLTALVAMAMSIRYRRIMHKQEVATLMMVYLVPFIGGMLSVYSYGFVYVQMGLTMGVIFIFMSVQNARAWYLAEQEKELMQSQMRIAMSQIQPHFLFNALNSIEYLCYTDGEQAGDAVNHLALFLRENMQSISQEKPIPFSSELEHVKNYVYIEQLRFPHIQVVYDTPVTDFSLPPLSVQPIVENAIKHGLRNKLEDAEVRITTKEEEENYVVCIHDNGNGFDSSKVSTDGKEHVGLENVKERMRMMCSGDMEISGNEEGTTVVLRIPKKRSTKQ